MRVVVCSSKEYAGRVGTYLLLNHKPKKWQLYYVPMYLSSGLTVSFKVREEGNAHCF